jgi:hypothetical protein
VGFGAALRKPGGVDFRTLNRPFDFDFLEATAGNRHVPDSVEYGLVVLRDQDIAQNRSAAQVGIETTNAGLVTANGYIQASCPRTLSTR